MTTLERAERFFDALLALDLPIPAAMFEEAESLAVLTNDCLFFAGSDWKSP